MDIAAYDFLAKGKISMRNYRIVSCILALLFLVASNASADVVFSNFGPGLTFGDSGFILQGPDVHNIGDVDQAASFMVGGSDTSVTGLKLGIYVSSPTNSPFDGRGPLAVSIAEDASGLPGSVLYSTTVDVQNFFKQVLDVGVGGSVQLNANTRYWVIADTQGKFDGAWYQNSTGDMSPSAGRTSGFPWNGHGGSTNFALEVDGRAVPEPSTALMMLSSVFVVGRLRRRTSRQ